MTVLEAEEARRIDAYWRAANYLSVGQIYLLDNPLLREPLRPEHVKPRLLGHWGTTPGLNFLYAHLNRAIRARDLDAIYVTGPGHGGPGARRQHLARGHATARSTRTSRATRRGCASCSGSSRFPAGSRATSRPRRPARSTRAASSATRSRTRTARRSTTPTCVVCCVVGDGEAETGPLAASWHSNKFLDPVARRRRAADPAPQRLQDRQPDGARAHPARRAGCAARGLRAPADLRRGRRARGDAPAHGGGARRGARRDRRDPARAPEAATLRTPALADDRAAHAEGLDRAARVEGTVGARTRCRSRRRARTRSTSRSSRRGCAPTGPRSCSTSDGRRATTCSRPAPAGERRMGANPHANGGLLLHDLRLPDFRDYAVDVPSTRRRRRARRRACSARFLRDVDRARTPTPSASSGPTRPRRTASAPCSR